MWFLYVDSGRQDRRSRQPKLISSLKGASVLSATVKNEYQRVWLKMTNYLRILINTHLPTNEFFNIFNNNMVQSIFWDN